MKLNNPHPKISALSEQQKKMKRKHNFQNLLQNKKKQGAQFGISLHDIFKTSTDKAQSVYNRSERTYSIFGYAPDISKPKAAHDR